MSASNDKITPVPLTFATFLESVPPGSERKVTDLFKIEIIEHLMGPLRGPARSGPPPPSWKLNTPDIRLHCPTETCGGDRVFTCTKGGVNSRGYHPENVFLIYSCRNCTKASKTYSLRVALKKQLTGSAVKYGEMPTFGPPLPNRLLKMAGDDSDLLLKGRQTENQGLGIGAFAYYRRVVENQKNRLLEDIRKAAVRLEADDELLSSIDLAIKETRFSEALKLVKDAIPDGLKVKGQNPLTLLHRALSKGVHGLDDTECLERAQVVRHVLTKLVSNIALVTKEERDLDEAVSKLQSIK